MTPSPTPAAAHDRPGAHAPWDGNAAAGQFADIFAGDTTTITVRCGTCDAAQAFAQVHAYLGGPGSVLRCRECEAIVARVAHTPHGTWLDISGSTSWLFSPTPDPT